MYHHPDMTVHDILTIISTYNFGVYVEMSRNAYIYVMYSSLKTFQSVDIAYIILFIDVAAQHNCLCFIWQHMAARCLSKADQNGAKAITPAY